jgi:hypothetical protein
MPRRENAMHEVTVLRFFEESPFEKADAVFNIVAQKMRERRSSATPDGQTLPKKKSKRVSSEPDDRDPLPGSDVG